MTTNITKVVDGDTLYSGDEKIRLSNINTPESKHKDKSRNTPEGKLASEFAADVLPVGSEIQTTKRDVDRYGRTVGDVTRIIGGVEVDYGLVALDQGFSDYYTAYGQHKDPMMHNAYKEYYSKDVPYQFGATEKPLTPEEFKEMELMQTQFKEIHAEFKEGKATQDQLDAITARLYGDKDKVLRYRHQVSNWDRPIEEEDELTLRGAMRIAMEDNPELVAEYNKTTINSHLMHKPVPEADPTWWDNTELSFRMFNSIGKAADLEMLFAKRNLGEDIDIPDEELLKGVPEKYHTLVLKEATKYNTLAALELRDQIIIDVQDDEDFSDLSFFAQLGYGAVAMVADPVTLMAGGAAAKTGQTVIAGTRAWQATRVGSGVLTKHADKLATLGAWTIGGGFEGAVSNAPRLAADVTYNAKDLMLDTVVDGAIGVGLGIIAEGAKPVIRKITPSVSSYWNEIRGSRAKELEQIHNAVEMKQQNISEPATPELVEIAQEAHKIEHGLKTNLSVGRISNTPIVPFQAITKVTAEGFKSAAKTVSPSLPRNGTLVQLLRRQAGLNKKVAGADVPTDVKELTTKLNADILHIVSAFPDGKLPKHVEDGIKKATYYQKTLETIDVPQRVAMGTEGDTVGVLKGWAKALKNNKSLWPEGTKLEPVNPKLFMTRYSDMISRSTDLDTGEIVTIGTNIPKELSVIKDMIEINKDALMSTDSELLDVVSKLNGMVDNRIKQMEAGKLQNYSDSSKSFGKTRQRTPDEILKVLKDEGLNVQNPEYVKRRAELQDMHAGKKSPKQIADQLKSEGLTPRTAEYRKRFNELKKEAIPVTKEVNQLGKQDIYRVGEERTVFNPELDAGELDPSVERSVNTEDAVTELFTEQLDQGLLPTSYNKALSTNAYDSPNKETLQRLREALNRDVIKPLGLKELHGKKENAAQQARIEKIAKVLTTKPEETIKRMIASGSWNNVEDVITASHTLAQAKQVELANKSSTDNITTGENTNKFDTKPLDEDTDLEVLFDDNTGRLTPKVSEEEFVSIKNRATDSYMMMVQDSTKKVAKSVADFVASGEYKAFQLAKKPTGVLDYAGRTAGKITEDLGTKLQNSDIVALEFIGSRVTEIGRGYGGNIRRKATGGLMRDYAYKESVMKIVPQYVNMIDGYAASKGKGAVGRMNAQQMSGADSKVVKEFNRDVFTVQELRRQGREVPVGTSEHVLAFVKQWDHYMDHNHNELVKAGIGGFRADRKVKHYIPHVWMPKQLNLAIKKHGEEKVFELLRRGYASAKQHGTNRSNMTPEELAKRQMDWIKEQGELAKKKQKDLKPNEIVEDQFLPVKDSRAKHRMEIDTTIEMDGLSVLDLLDNDVVGIGMKYSNRMSGWVGLSKSTDGLLNSELAIKAMKENIIAEGKEKGIKTEKYEQYYDDLMNMMFGRPTRGGLKQELRQLKDLTALTRMGGLGTAQVIETGQVVTRSVLNTFSSEPVAKRILNAATKSEEDTLIREIQAISNITDDLEWLDRQSVHLDQAELNDVHRARQVSLWVADKATGGSFKAPASRLLGKVTGYNGIRRIQSRAVQASFTLDVAKHFRHGSGQMSNARLADLGLTDAFGKDVELQKVFDSFVEYGEDGLPTKLNFDKWSQSAQDKFKYALLRDESQQIQRTHVGELPPWMNKPIMQLIMQFRQMPIVANNKQLGRNMAFADREAVVSTLLNTAIAGLVRYSKFAALGYAVHKITGDDGEVSDPTYKQMQVDRYIASAGIYSDAVDLVLSSVSAGQKGEDFKESVSGVTDALLGQVPVWGLANDYVNSVMKDKDEQVDAAFGLLPLGNTAMGVMANEWINATFNND